MYIYPVAFGLPATVPRFVTCGLCMWRQVLSSSVHLLKSFGHLRGHSGHLLRTVLGASCDWWSVYVATGVVVICAPFAIIWVPWGSLVVPFGYHFGVPGARLGTLGSHLGSFGGPLDPRGRQGAKRMPTSSSRAAPGTMFGITFGTFFGTLASQNAFFNVFSGFFFDVSFFMNF